MRCDRFRANVFFQVGNGFAYSMLVCKIVCADERFSEPSIRRADLWWWFLVWNLQLRPELVNRVLDLEDRRKGRPDSPDVFVRWLKWKIADHGCGTIQQTANESETAVELDELVHEI